jgi:hypothetical protein
VDSYDPRWGDDLRDRDDNCRDLSRGSRGGSDPRDRERVDPRDVFMEHVNLPRGLDREHVHYHGHDYTLRGSETRTLTTVGAFRAVPAKSSAMHSTGRSTHVTASSGTFASQAWFRRCASTATTGS